MFRKDKSIDPPQEFPSAFSNKLEAKKPAANDRKTPRAEALACGLRAGNRIEQRVERLPRQLPCRRLREQPAVQRPPQDRTRLSAQRFQPQCSSLPHRVQLREPA